MPCELCGREAKSCREAIIDGAKMYVCQDCIRYAEGGALQNQTQRPASPIQAPRLRKAHKPEKDIFAVKDMEKELVPDWNHRIEEGRKKRGMTREELGFKIGERTVTIAKLENGDLRPSDQMIKKIEKELGLHLLEEIKTVPTAGQNRPQGGFTLGDFIKTEK